MPTPSPPKRGVNQNKKVANSAETDEIEFNVDNGSPYANTFKQDTDSENPFAPASPQTNPSTSPAQTLKVSKKKKKGGKLIKPIPMN